MFKYKIVAKRREKLGLSQADISQLTNIRVPALSRIENGKQMNPTLLTLEKLAKSLQCHIADFIDESNPTQ